ncbi:MAG: transposase [Terriglobia bacterium]
MPRVLHASLIQAKTLPLLRRLLVPQCSFNEGLFNERLGLSRRRTILPLGRLPVRWLLSLLQLLLLLLVFLLQLLRLLLVLLLYLSNEVRLWLTIIAYNLGNLWRRLVLPQRIGNWSLTSLQQRLVKTGGRLVKPARYYWLLLAESRLTRRLFGAMVQRMAALTIRAG